MFGCSLRCDLLSERNLKSQERAKMLASSKVATFESKVSDAVAAFTESFVAIAILGGEPDYEKALAAVCEHNRLYIESCELTTNESWRNMFDNAVNSVLSFYLVLSPLPQFDFDITEEKMVKVIEYYQHAVCSPVMKAKGMKMDYFLAGFLVPVAGLWHGNGDALRLWHSKTLAAFNDIDLPSTKAYKEYVYELSNISNNALPVFALLELQSEASLLLKSIGFQWHNDFENVDAFIEVFCVVAPFVKPQIEKIHKYLLIYNSSSPGIINEEEVNKIIPSPNELAKMEQGYPLLKRFGVYDLTSTGARAFLKLGRDDDAYELSRIAVSPEQKTEKKTTLVDCHSILGQIAAKRGNLDEAESHFANAMKEAKLSRLPMLEVLVARNMKKHLLEPNGRDCSVAEEGIDSACRKMNKTREEVAWVLKESGSVGGTTSTVEA